MGEWMERKVCWIAVSDELPPLGRCVLGADACGQVHEAFRAGRERWQWSHGSDAAITHWMELPTPPAQSELNRVAAM